MLFLNTVQSDTYELLKKLMQIPELCDFVLVGGTNLSLKFGHRISVDLDLFTNNPFDIEEVLVGINRNLPQSIKLDQRKQTIWLNIDGIKVDVILHPYPYLQAIEVIDGVEYVLCQ
jgi:hypothetical protein